MKLKKTLQLKQGYIQQGQYVQGQDIQNVQIYTQQPQYDQQGQYVQQQDNQQGQYAPMNNEPGYSSQGVVG
jgi:hypothetical protein